MPEPQRSVWVLDVKMVCDFIQKYIEVENYQKFRRLKHGTEPVEHGGIRRLVVSSKSLKIAG